MTLGMQAIPQLNNMDLFTLKVDLAIVLLSTQYANSRAGPLIWHHSLVGPARPTWW